MITPSLSLAGRTALVTGASGGLGAHFARVLAEAGARVAVAARRRVQCEIVCADIAAAGGEAFPVALDVTDAASVKAAINGLDALDILINNAGIAATIGLMDLSEAEWDSVVDTNLKGAFLTGREAARRMRGTGGGVIVNIASILGHRVAGGVAPYAASKAALVQLTRSMALEWARFNIRVNALCPGYIETELNRDFFLSEPGQALIRRIPQRRLGRPEDLDMPLLLLAGPGGTFMTGSALVVDGGHLVSSL